jgi:hypothetical protein
MVHTRTLVSAPGVTGVRAIAVTRPDSIEKILEHVARQPAPPELSAISAMATVH